MLPNSGSPSLQIDPELPPPAAPGGCSDGLHMVLVSPLWFPSKQTPLGLGNRWDSVLSVGPAQELPRALPHRRGHLQSVQ